MTDLSDLIRQRIAEDGPLSLADFMGIALTHADGGYYITRDPFGVAGDFTTAPEVSQMFGELIGLWSAVTWQSMGGPDPVRVVELGPGRGTLMADLLRAAHAVPAFARAIRPHLVEISPTLRAAQEQALGAAGPDHAPTWHTALGEVPLGPSIIIANEFFDALPVRQFERTEEGWRERLVDSDPAGGFCVTLSRKEVARLGPAPEGSVQEICPEGNETAAAIGRRLAAFGGVALIIDYGHEETALGDTLQAVRDHAFAPVLEAPGEADLTAHVDFEALANAAQVAGARAYGPVPQGHFLMALGLAERTRALLDAADARQREDIAAAQHRLAHPDEMGLLFKVLALGAPDLPTPAGFEGA